MDSLKQHGFLLIDDLKNKEQYSIIKDNIERTCNYAAEAVRKNLCNTPQIFAFTLDNHTYATICVHKKEEEYISDFGIYVPVQGEIARKYPESSLKRFKFATSWPRIDNLCKRPQPSNLYNYDTISKAWESVLLQEKIEQESCRTPSSICDKSLDEQIAEAKAWAENRARKNSMQTIAHKEQNNRTR